MDLFVPRASLYKIQQPEGRDFAEGTGTGPRLLALAGHICGATRYGPNRALGPGTRETGRGRPSLAVEGGTLIFFKKRGDYNLPPQVFRGAWWERGRNRKKVTQRMGFEAGGVFLLLRLRWPLYFGVPIRGVRI